MTRQTLLLTTVAVIAAAASPAAAQNRWSQFAVDDDWSNDSNWDLGFAPDAEFDSEAILGSTTLGAAPSATAEVSGSVTNAPTTILGNGAGTTGVLSVPAGASFGVISDLGTGDLRVGVDGGAGTLNVGGVVTVENRFESASGAAGSQINLTGSASVTADNAFFDRQLRIDGSDVSLSVTGQDGAVFGLAGTHTWVIPASGASTVSVTNNADLGGTLNVEFSGVTPTVGQTWNLIDAGSIDGADAVPSGFGNVTTTADGSLGAGERFAVSAVPSVASTNGVYAQLALEQHPILRVNRETGAVTLENPGGVASIDFDTYVIGSQLGGLDAGAFTGGFSQGDGWYDANPSSTAISELNPTGSGSVAAGSNLSLGAIYAPPTPSVFGEENEDLTFQYARPGGGLIQGDVVLEGLPNNTLVLNVDPSTGETQLVNPSGFNVGIDAYVISSTSDSLSTAAWNSLADQGVEGGDWFEANPSSSELSELLVDGATSLLGNRGGVLDLGSPFLTSGEQDLVFRFALEGDTTLRTGKVVYGAQLTAVALPGDYNGDNVVDAADYVAYRNALGSMAVLPNDTTPGAVTEADLNVWRGNYGASLAPGTAAAVPEPAAALSAAGLLLLGALGRPTR